MSDTKTSETTSVFALPSLGADMDSGIVLKWYVEPGQEVSRGDIVARIETEKSDIDVEIWQSGVVEEHLAEIGDELPVGSPLLRIKGANEDTRGPEVVPDNGPEVEAALEPEMRAETTPSPRAAEPAPTATKDTHSARDTASASPLARSVARTRGIDLSKVAGSGPGGAVLVADLEQAPSKPSKPEPADRMRRAIADRMIVANREIPHYHLHRDVDLGAAMEWLRRRNEKLSPPERILPAALFMKAVAAAAEAQPDLNGFWTDDHFEPGDGVHVAVAISLRSGGLVTPVLTVADHMSVTQTMARLKELVAGARSGSLRSSWMTGATITVTNLGDNGADSVDGVIFPPQVALIGFGRVLERPWIVEGMVRPRPVVTVSLSADHRATDGATGSRFLSVLAQRLQQPEEL